TFPHSLTPSPPSPTLSPYTTLFRSAELGHDPATIYRRTNQHRRLVPPPTEGRLSHDEAPLFWLAADALTGDPDIGLHLGEVMKRSEEHTSELQSRENLVCRLLLEKK